MQDVSVRTDSDCTPWVTFNNCTRWKGFGKSEFSISAMDRQSRAFFLFVLAILTCFLILNTGSAIAETEISFEKAQKMAKQQNKMLLVFFEARQDAGHENFATAESAAGPRPVATAGHVQKVDGRQVRQVNYDQRGKHRSGNFNSSSNAIEQIWETQRDFQPSTRSMAAVCRHFDRDILAATAMQELLENYIVYRVSTNDSLFREPRFAEMCRLPGIAMLDFRDASAPHYGEVVSVFPFLNGKAYTAEQMRTILTLPPGTVTQRSLIYAIRIHPERPASTNSEQLPILQTETTGHCEYMARIGVQGHQNFDARFQRIARSMGTWGVSEVCAESWRGEPLLQAAIGCVKAWRSSPGHWRGVSGSNRYYAYDMRKGGNGTWYATGLFVK